MSSDFIFLVEWQTKPVIHVPAQEILLCTSQHREVAFCTFLKLDFYWILNISGIRWIVSLRYIAANKWKIWYIETIRIASFLEVKGKHKRTDSGIILEGSEKSERGVDSDLSLGSGSYGIHREYFDKFEYKNNDDNDN